MKFELFKDVIELNHLFIETISNDNITEFNKYIKRYNYYDFYKIKKINSPNDNFNTCYKYTIIGLVLELDAYYIFLYLLKKDIDFNEFSISNSDDSLKHVFRCTPLAQILYSKNSKISKHWFKLCKKLLYKKVSLNDIAEDFQSDRLCFSSTGNEICYRVYEKKLKPFFTFHRFNNFF